MYIKTTAQACPARRDREGQVVAGHPKNKSIHKSIDVCRNGPALAWFWTDVGLVF
jgi:hypothetical protein